MTPRYFSIGESTQIYLQKFAKYIIHKMKCRVIYHLVTYDSCLIANLRNPKKYSF